jgi:4-hydroxythreonine-4-phosphate dehydrogenase
MGDPVGVGPEIIVKALVDARIYQVCRPLVLGDLSALDRARLALDSALKIHVADRPAAGHYQLGTLDPCPCPNWGPPTFLRPPHPGLQSHGGLYPHRH